VNLLLEEVKARVEEVDSVVSGFNVGINSGEDAGQTIPHCHVHLIPRRKGDVKNPRGGIRGVIPGKASY
jgi:ATP adenylyltransferase